MGGETCVGTEGRCLCIESKAYQEDEEDAEFRASDVQVGYCLCVTQEKQRILHGTFGSGRGKTGSREDDDS